MSNPDLTQLDPPEIDHLWTEAMQPAYAAYERLAATRASIRRYEKHGYRRETTSGPNQIPAYLTDRETEQEAEYEQARKASEPFDAEYERRGGWTRYMIVINSNGHVHRITHGRTGTSCPSLRWGTLYRPLWQLSGRDDAGVVSEFGATACSKCFPDAPVESKALPEGYCPGSGQNMDPDKPSRTGYYTGNWGTCPVCGDHVTLTTSHGPRLRRHKPKGA